MIYPRIYYIPLGSFCYPKMIIRETGREYSESLPFDFNSSPHLSGITNILKELYEKGKYNIELKEILWKYNGDELAISEKNNIYLVHFFKEHDLIKNLADDEYPAPVTNLKINIINDIKNKFNKRFERLYNLLNDENSILCFLRIENYDNPNYHNELIDFTEILSKFRNPNKFLIYSQNLIDENLHFDNVRSLNYNYSIPIFFYKYYFYDMVMINNKNIFIDLLNTFEYLINNENIINIMTNNIIEKYYIDKEKYKLYKLTNINYCANCFIDEYEILYINNVISGYDKYIKYENFYFKE
jgi:hypothetical protein